MKELTHTQLAGSQSYLYSWPLSTRGRVKGKVGYSALANANHQHHSYCHQKLLPSKPPSPMPFPRPININIDLYMHRVNLIVPHATCINCVALLVTKSNLRCVLIIALCQLISSTSILHALCNLQRITSPASPHSLTHYLLGMGNL